MTTISLIVPCYNEREGLPRLLAALAQARRDVGPEYGWELVFVDDGSTDGTSELLEEACSQTDEARVIHHPHNRGLGAALRTGFGQARGELIATVDSDCTYDPRELAQMVRRLEQGADIVVASPYHPAGGVLGVPGYRQLLSRNLSRLYRRVTGSPVYTYTSLFRLYRAEAVRALRFRSDGFLAMAEILVDALLQGFRVVEHPTRLAVRQWGESKAVILRLIRDHIGFLAWLMWRKLWGRERPQPHPVCPPVTQGEEYADTDQLAPRR
jgi:dolichol-phosphate mannosyltransferase